MKSTKIFIISAVLAVLGVGKSTALELKQNFPNPFNTWTCISFELVEKQNVSLNIYNLKGARVCTLLDGAALTADNHEAIWDGCDYTGRMSPAGVYLYRLETGNFVETRRMTLTK